jgi:hypothetical protein
MKEANVKDDLRLVQVFLGSNKNPGPGVFEVSTDKNGTLYCNCQGFIAKRNCKHVSFVKTRIENNNGNYPLEILRKATQEEADVAKESNEEYRRFIIKYGKIEVF